jgi:hypothetical protein
VRLEDDFNQTPEWGKTEETAMPKKKQSSRSLHCEYGPDAPRALSGMMLDASERFPLPSRFMVKAGDHPSGVVLLDTLTGRSVSLGLCDLIGARIALGAFFGD